MQVEVVAIPGDRSCDKEASHRDNIAYRVEEETYEPAVVPKDPFKHQLLVGADTVAFMGTPITENHKTRFGVGDSQGKTANRVAETEIIPGKRRTLSIRRASKGSCEDEVPRCRHDRLPNRSSEQRSRRIEEAVR